MLKWPLLQKYGDKEVFIEVLNLDLVQISSGNHSSLLRYSKNYGCEKFNSLGSGVNVEMAAAAKRCFY
jgi:hypothetical protein